MGRLILKRVLVGLLIFVLVIATWIVVGSRDEDRIEDHGLLERLQPILDDANGYGPISYTQDPAFSIYQSPEVGRKLQRHVLGEEWNDDFAEAMILANAMHITNAAAAAKYPSFKLPVGSDIGAIPNYMPILDMSRLLILKSMWMAKHDQLSESVNLAKSALALAQLVLNDANQILISRLIGYVMQYEALQWIQELAGEVVSNDSAYQGLHEALERLPDYSEDGFSKVFSGEYAFGISMLDSILDRPLTKRWSDYFRDQDWWRSVEEESSSGVSLPAKNRELAAVLFPDFYLHRNRVFGEMARELSGVAEKSADWCVAIEIESSAGEPDVRWADVIRSNSIGDSWGSNVSSYNEYFYRRCFMHAHQEGAKAIVAALKYRKDHGELPESLEALIPEYLSAIPIDPFDGKALRYSKAHGYFYSVGMDFRDDGGSVAGRYRKRCEEDAECATNPTFFIDVVTSHSDEGG